MAAPVESYASMPGLSLHSSRTPTHRVSLGTAVLEALAPDGGLYVPDSIRRLPVNFWQEWRSLSFPDLGARVLSEVIQGALPEDTLLGMCRDAFSFPVPLVPVAPGIHVLELFHGPTLAFKDFGARLMARMMAWYAGEGDVPLTILAATSGDTGGAVASAFLGVAGTRVVILYPKGRVSPLQEKQLTTLGQNITALEVDGSFDDCQRMVKAAFSHGSLASQKRLASANSINIARLLPQMLYYFEGARQLPPDQRPTFVVPSGNFGNLTAGLLASLAGLPVEGFVAATNRNDTIPRFLRSGTYEPAPSLVTPSNAMDVGAPSNFERMQCLFPSLDALRARLAGFSAGDAETLSTMARVHREFGYLLDPHTAVAWLAAEERQRQRPDAACVVLATAHPAKFLEIGESVFGPGVVPVPERLACLAERPKSAHPLPAEDQAFLAWLEGF